MNNTKNSRNEKRKGLKSFMVFFIATMLAIGFVTFIVTPPKVYAIKETAQPEKNIDEIVSTLNAEMDISNTSGISKEDFIYALENCVYDKNGVLGKNAEAIWNSCQKYQLNEFAFCGMIAFESGWCDSKLAQNRKNILSIKNANGEYIRYDSYAKCIEDGAKLLRKNYINNDSKYSTGGKLTDIAYIYLGGETYIEQWCDGVSSCANLCTKALLS